MSVFERVRARIRRAFRTSTAIGKDKKVFRGGFITVTLDDDSLVSESRTLASMGYKRAVSTITAEECAVGLRDLTRNHAYKFRKSGSLYRSIYYRRAGRKNIFEINSDSVYKATWLQDDYQGSPPPDNIRSWMNDRRIGSGQTEREKGRIAFAIARSIREGRGSPDASRSHLRSLNPSGSRFYNYPEMARLEFEPVLRRVGVAITEGIWG